ncbi:ABC transporter permease [Hespellia stercorisuis]|uniref:Putative ABC transport system permease protein n=1 Tax=Hespellia stercorisuis DSM 15480 TaxID=1121950 RepID=A0A1M6UIW0_9FIRM|nr:FtsX-like permease family protein [Hespellia stercorisuis]SHK69111.1 putative ABC transport system permease protein [Hespellia stercorisuis DSM 15480]
MRRVSNKAFIRKLADKSFRASRTRNIIAVVAIALTATLFTTLFTIGIGTIENFQQQTMRQAGGDSHGVIKDISPQMYEKMSQDPSVKECADTMLVAYSVENPEFLKRHVEAWYYPEYHYPHCFVDILDGRAPQKADEILLDEESMNLLGLELKAGQKVTLQMKIRSSADAVTERTFTVSGVTKSDPALNVGFAIVSEAYRGKYADELVYTYDQDGSTTGTVRMDVNFANSFSIQKKLERVIENSGYSSDETDPDYVASNANWAYVSDGGETDPVTAGAAIGGLILIILTGYLIIYNIFQISVIRDIRYYGLLKTIGTTGRQIRTIIRRQAFVLGFIGIPLGLIGGFIMGKAVVPRVMEVSAYGSDSVAVSMSPSIFIGAAAFSLLTIWISTGKPARIAAKVSPVEAVRFTEQSGRRKNKKRSTDGGKLWRMAFSNLGRNRKKTVLVILSLSLALVLLNSVFTVADSFDMNTYLKKFVSYDFQIANARYFGMDPYRGISEDEVQEEKLSESLIESCKEQDGFQEGGRIYETDGCVGLRKDSWKVPSYVPTDENGVAGKYWNGQFSTLNLMDEENYRVSFYGIEDFYYSRLEVWKGEKDWQTIREKMKTGKYVIATVEPDDNGFVEKEEVWLLPGDKVTLTYGGGQQREFEVLSVVKTDYWSMTNRLNGNFKFYVPAELFKEMASDQYLMSYGFDVDDDKEQAVSDFLTFYTTQEEPLMDFTSRQSYIEQFARLTQLFTLVGGILAMVVGVIGVLNFINTILTGIVTRQREFAMLEAVGMTKKQLGKMLMLEGLYYAVLTIVISLVFGSVFSVTALRLLIGGMWFLKYHFVIWPMAVTFPILLILGVLVPKAVLRFEKKKSVVEIITNL